MGSDLDVSNFVADLIDINKLSKGDLIMTYNYILDEIENYY